MKQVRASVRISGRVQGVCFRHYTQQTACQQQLTGWVRNLPSGEVEAVFEGPETAVRTVLNWCQQGPSGARVDELLIDWEEPSGEFGDFRVRN